MAAIDWKTVEEALEPIVEARGVFLVGHAERRERGRRIIQLFVDTDEGISIGLCADLSRELGAKLDRLNAVNEPYELEVSSPGIDRPLILLRQYRKNVGRTFTVKYWQDAERKTLKGTLSAVTDDRLTFVAENGEPTTIEFPKIIESIEELPW